MIPLAICVAILALIFWAANRYDRKIHVLHKWYSRHDKIKLDAEGVALMIKSCDLLMDVYPDPQSDEYRTALELKLRLEKASR